MVTPYRYYLGLASKLESAVAGSMRPELGEILLQDVQSQVMGGIGPDGEQWAPLKFPRPTGGNQPLFNTGGYLAAFSVAGMPGGIALVSNHPGAMTHQHGATITPKRGKALTIPLTAEAANSGGAKSMPKLFRIKNGLYGYQGQKLVKHWLLVKQVVIPARPVGLSSEAKGLMLRTIVSRAIAEGKNA